MKLSQDTSSISTLAEISYTKAWTDIIK
jgi:hypothetical protein